MTRRECSTSAGGHPTVQNRGYTAFVSEPEA